MMSKSQKNSYSEAFSPEIIQGKCMVPPSNSPIDTANVHRAKKRLHHLTTV